MSTTDVDPLEVVAIRHPDVDEAGTATRDAVEKVWGPLGWSIDERAPAVAPTGEDERPPALNPPAKNATTEQWEQFLTLVHIEHDPDGERKDFIAAWESSPLNT